MRKIKTIVLAVLLLILALQSSAMVFDPADFTYVIHLYYDGNKFVPNSGTRFQYDVIAENFEQPAVETSKPYTGRLVSSRGQVLSSFVFDPKYVDTPVGRGPVEVKAPYFANAKSINIFDNNEKLILTINVGETLVCNENSICDSEAGEDFLACPSDCKSQVPTPVVSEEPTPTDGDDNNLVWIILGITILIAFVTWLIMRKQKGSGPRATIKTPPANLPGQGPSISNVPKP